MVRLKTFDAYLAMIREDENGCWLLPKKHNGQGYIKVQDGPSGGRLARAAHRVFYERLAGSIPPGLTIDHLCRNRACVRPKWAGDPNGHTEPVPHVVNVMRGIGVGAVNAARSACRHGHPFERMGKRRFCRVCKNEANRRLRSRKALARGPRPLKPECKRGHAFTNENTYVEPRGRGRQCRQCNKIRMAAFKERAAASGA